MLLSSSHSWAGIQFVCKFFGKNFLEFRLRQTESETGGELGKSDRKEQPLLKQADLSMDG